MFPAGQTLRTTPPPADHYTESHLTASCRRSASTCPAASLRQLSGQLLFATPNTPFYDARPAGQTDAGQVASTLDTATLYSTAPCNSSRSRSSPPTGEVLPVDRLTPKLEVTSEFNDRTECRGHLGIACTSQPVFRTLDRRMAATRNQPSRVGMLSQRRIQTVAEQ